MHNGNESNGGIRRWVRVGRSANDDSRAAGSEAAGEALAGSSDARLLVLFCSDAHDPEALLEGVSESAGELPLIGCSTAGEIATDGPSDAGVVITAFGGEGFSVATAAATGVSERLRDAGAEAASCIERLDDRPYRALLLLTDGLAGDQQEIVRGAYGVVGAGVPLVGGCAGDDLRMQATRQFHGREVFNDAAVAAAVASDAPLGIGVRHGWRRIGEPVLVTRSEGTRVLELDDQPALDVYLDRLDAPEEARHDQAAFTEFAMTHPLGLSRRGEEEHVRFVSDVDFDDRAIVSIAEMPQGGLAWFMEGDQNSVLDATDAACEAALDQLGDGDPLGLVAFDCVARRGVLGDPGIGSEVERIADQARGAPVAGFYSYGEIARTHGVSGFHNQTLVVLAVG